MDDFQHYESHEDNVYENGEWINGEFYATGQRKGRTQTRDEQLYGYDSDEEYEGRKGKRQKKQQDFAQPVSFVSGGITGSSTEKPEEIGKAEQDIGHQQPSANGLGGAGLGLGFAPGDENAGLGLGFGQSNGAASGGLGFQSAGLGLGAEAMPGDGDNDDAFANLPSTFGKRIAQGAAQRLKREKAAQERATEERRQVKKFSSSSAGPQAAIPTMTNPAVAKMMAAMGHKAGQGLGKHGQGITTNISVQQRRKNEGLGNSSEHKMELEPKKAKEEPAKAKAKHVDPRLWKKEKAAARQQRIYKTADEVLAEQSEKAAPMSQPILDMRGPQARVITDMDELGSKAETAEDDIPMPELQHNLRVMVDLAAAEIQRLDGKLRHSKDTSLILSREAENLKSEAGLADEKAEHLRLITERLDQAESAASSLSLQDLHQIYSGLQYQYPEEYVMYDLPAIALTQVLPRIFAVMADAMPMSDPSKGVQEIHMWRALLESAEQANALYVDIANPSSDPYSTLLSMTVIPKLQSAVTNHWDPQNPEPMLVWMETWRANLPPNIEHIILDTLVFPKISRALEAWNPQQDPIPVHAWLHPWLQLLGTRMEALYPTIRFRLSSALKAWHPSDGSAYALLEPWKKVWEEADWNHMMVQSILPALATALNQFHVNPANQDMGPFYWITSWASVIAPEHFVSLLEAHFFPQWQAALQYWLNNSPDYEEVSNWYLNWKGQIPAEVLSHERIQWHFGVALETIDAAMENRALPVYHMPPVQDAYTRAASVAQAPSFSRWGGGTVAAAPEEPSLTDLVQVYANEHNLAFAPKNRRHEGLQVYGFGSVSVVLDNVKSNIRAQLDGAWKLVSLEELIAENAKRVGRK